MKHISFKLLGPVLFIFLLAQAQPSPTTSIAVYPVKTKGKCDPSLGSALTSLLIYNLSQSPKLKVIEEETLKLVFERQGLNTSDLCDSTICQVEIGKLVQAQKIIVGELIKMGEKFMLTLRVTDVQSGTVDFSVKRDCACLEDQLDALALAGAVDIRNFYGENLTKPVLPMTPLKLSPGSAAAGTPAAGTFSAPPEISALPNATPEIIAKFLAAVKSNNQTEVFRMLSQYKGLANQKYQDGNYPLHEASERGHKDMAELLLAKGADVNAKNKYGWTPLHRAAIWGQKEVAELLISKGADINAKDNNGSTPLHDAAHGGYQVSDLLISKGADVNARDIHGNTPLHHARTKEVAELLMSKGADINARNNLGNTPLGVAAALDYQDVVELLRQHGGHK